MRKILKAASVQGMPFVLLLLRPLWMTQSRVLMFVFIGLLVGTSLVIVARAFRAGMRLPPRLRQTVKTLFPFNDKFFPRIGQ